jgi:hypothetical protein
MDQKVTDYPAVRPYRLGGAAAGTLGISGQFFTLNGHPWTAIESSDFSLLKRALDGEDIEPILADRAALGFNMFRIWLLNQSVIRWRNGTDDGQRIHPDDYPDFYDVLRWLVGRCADHGLCCDLTVFTSCGSLMPDPHDQQTHLDSTAWAVRDLPNVLLSLVNEADQHDNATADLSRPAGVLITRGSNGADSPPPHHDAPWDAEEYHSNDLSEWQRKVGHNAWEFGDQSGKPCWSSENTRPDRDGSDIHFEDAAAGAALLCAGACFHSNQGKYSTLYSGRDLMAAIAWVKGAQSVPLEFQRGVYHHRTDLEGPDCIRAYDRTLPDGRAWIVKIRP